MTNLEWQLSGSLAERYEEFLVPVIFTPWSKKLLQLAGLKKENKLLDLACGTGIVSRMAAKDGIFATGADINEGMLRVARKETTSANVDYREADANDLPFKDGSFDAIICQHGLQFFPDKATALAECLRVLKPGGRTIFCTARKLAENPLMKIQADAYRDYLDEDCSRAIASVCGFPDLEETRKVFASAGFDPVEVKKVVLTLHSAHAETFVDGLLKSTPVSVRISKLSAPKRNELYRAILNGFGDYIVDNQLDFPHSANVTVAIKPLQ